MKLIEGNILDSKFSPKKEGGVAVVRKKCNHQSQFIIGIDLNALILLKLIKCPQNVWRKFRIQDFH